ncbi:helix-turn-helix transcriptional regulator [Microbispora sp. NBC_01389]|uniref:helix-turn-helix transcriptional regulator n=1 Tax=Microbispora sp. NBC_01389 TaxID=2903584 RepID=UPI003250AD65
MKTTQYGMASRSRRHRELKEFLRSRRARLSPGEVGLAGGGRRRTPGLRREEVAVLAGVGTSWYIQLEQGRDITVSPSVLDAVSRALRLSPLEREHLYRLAGTQVAETALREVPDADRLRRLVDNWMPSPAHVVDRYWNVSVMNRAAELVFGFTPEDRNCLVSFFTSDHYRGRIRSWEKLALSLVAEFRRDAARFPDDPGFDKLAAMLSETSPEFAEIWSRHEVAVPAQGVKAIDHPTVGLLTFEHSTLHMPDRPDVRLVLHTAQAGTVTAGRLEALLAGDGGRARPGQVALAPAG